MFGQYLHSLDPDMRSPVRNYEKLIKKASVSVVFI